MANETEYGNIITQTNVISDGITPALVNPVVVAPLIRYEPLPVQTMVKLFRKDGYLTAETINQSAVQAVDGAEQELTQSSVTATIVKLAATCMLSVEAQAFTSMTLADVARYIGEAIGRDWDDEILALFSGFSGGVTAASTLTWDDVLDAQYTVRSGTNGVSWGTLRAVLDFKGAKELRKEFNASAAASLSLESQLELLRGIGSARGYIGSKSGVEVFETSGLPTATTDDVALVFDPELAFGAMASNAPMVKTRWLGGAGDGTRGFCDEVSGWIFCDVIEWNDAAGCMLKSDT
jgi:hypothetical protein